MLSSYGPFFCVVNCHFYRALYRLTTLCCYLCSHRPSFVSKSALSAEWEKEWKETDFEGDLAKLQKEAEERLDDKIAELMSNIEKTGAEGN